MKKKKLWLTEEDKILPDAQAANVAKILSQELMRKPLFVPVKRNVD